MSLSHSPGIVTNGLVHYFDMGNSQKSWQGMPTTNLAGETLLIYNNVPSHVSITLTATSEKYNGATVYKQVITPITATGVGHLTGGANPGIGVYHSGGGGTANRYTGFGIFYRSTVPMHTTPLFTNYSNIAGWGAGALGSDRSVSMGDGWSRGEVIWYDTVTRTDNKFWAINPATATLNVPITVYWAGPFKEDRNDSTAVARYTISSRSNTQALLDLTRRNTITATSLTYAANDTFSFNGSNSITLPNIASYDFSSEQTVEIWLKPTENDATRRNPYNQAYGGYGTWTHEPSGQFNLYYGDSGVNNVPYIGHTSGFTVLENEVACICSTRNVNESRWYKNGVYNNQYSHTYGVLTATTADITIGSGYAGGYVGDIYAVKIYNRALSASEVQQNFNALKGRYGI